MKIAFSNLCHVGWNMNDTCNRLKKRIKELVIIGHAWREHTL